MYVWFSKLPCQYIVGQSSPTLFSRSNPHVRLGLGLPRWKHNIKQEHLTQKSVMERSKLKEKGFPYSPGTVSLQVLGSGARGAPTSLYIFTDNTRYMFNCGEGTQRLASEHKMKISKLEHIFVTNSSWKNIGGLPGIALTVQDVGVKGLTLHGPPGVDEFFNATENFLKLNTLSISMAQCDEGTSFQDSCFTVTYVPVVSKVLAKKTGDTELSEPVIETSTEHSTTSTTNHSSSHSATIGSTLSSKTANGDPVVSPNISESESEHDVDYYKHERIRKRKIQEPKNRASKLRKLNGESWPPRAVDIAMSYICKLKDRPGVLSLQRCVDRNVPPGPLLGRLKSGEDVTLADGTVVLSRDVRDPDRRGGIFLVVECPSEGHLPSLVGNPAFGRYQAQARDDNTPCLVVHFTPPDVMGHPSYFAWMEKFSQSTRHLVLNESSRCMGSVAVHRAQYLLRSVSRGTGIFPSLRDNSIKMVAKSKVESASDSEDLPDRLQSVSPNSPVAPLDEDDGLEAQTRQSRFYRRLEGAVQGQPNLLILPRDQEDITSNQPDDGKEYQTQLSRAFFEVTSGQTLLKYHLRPYENFDWKSTLELHIDDYAAEMTQTAGEQCEEVREKLRAYFAQKKLATVERRAHPTITFLGTGSAIPNKSRNTSGILIRTSDKSYVIVDCGEGTYGQLIRLKGWHESNIILQNLTAIYVSHMHADHHIGLIGLIQARQRALESLSLPPGSKQKLLLLAPHHIINWLNFYHYKFEPILQEFELICNDKLFMGRHTLDPKLEQQLLARTGLSDVSTCKVIHCPHSYGVSFQHPDWKITYSGDTMPCEALEQLGMNSTLLIHEATMESELEEEAECKFHSTTSQAIESGRKMNARHVILTHFSQRYAKVPRIDGIDSCGNVGIAFDNMEVGLDDLADLPMMIPALKEVFSEHHYELEQKAVRRERRKKLLEVAA